MAAIEAKNAPKALEDKFFNDIRSAHWINAFKFLEQFPHYVNKTHPASQSGYTITHQAAWWGAPEIVFKMLAIYGASFDIKSKTEGTPIDIAKKRNNIDSYQILVKLASKEVILVKDDVLKEFTEVFTPAPTISINPFAAKQAQMFEHMEKKYQSFCTLLPGDACIGGNLKWKNCYNMSSRECVAIYNKVELDDGKGFLPEVILMRLRAQFSGFNKDDVLEPDLTKRKKFFINMIKAYTSPSMNLYHIINWNLRHNEWFNVQNHLGLIVFSLKQVCEGWCFKEFKEDKVFAPYYGTVYRGLELREEIEQQLKDMKPDDVFYFGGFTSCSKSSNVAQFLAESRQRLGTSSSKSKDRRLVMTINISKKHSPCAIDISMLSEADDEQEVLITTFTGFKLRKINFRKEGVEMEVDTVGPFEMDLKERAKREELADFAMVGDFANAFKLIEEFKSKSPNFINSTRPSSSKFWTVMHQAAYLGDEVAMKKLKTMGANASLRNSEGRRALELLPR